MLFVQPLRNIYQLVATNVKKARQRLDHTLPLLPPILKTEDMVLIKNHTAGPFDPVHIDDYQIVSIKKAKLKAFQHLEIKLFPFQMSNKSYQQAM